MNKWKSKFEGMALRYGDAVRANDSRDIRTYLKIQGLVENIVNAKKSGIVVDVGCGNGFFCKNLCYERRVYGIDFSLNMLRSAKENGVICIQSDALYIPLRSNLSDVTICVGVLQYLENDRDVNRCFEELIRITRRSGLILIATMNGEAILRRALSLFIRNVGVNFQRMFCIDDIGARLVKLDVEWKMTYFFHSPLAIWQRGLFPGSIQRLLAATFLIVGIKK